MKSILHFLHAGSKQTVYFLHINKTGGMYIRNMLNPSAIKASQMKFKMCSHGQSVLDVPDDRPFFFTVRDPFDRMCSGVFHLFRAYKKNEIHGELYSSLNSFEGPEAFIESLCRPDHHQHALAKSMHATFPHISRSYWSFFISKEYFKSKSSRILLALETSRLSQDFARMMGDMGITTSQRDDASLAFERKRSPGISSYRNLFTPKIFSYYENHIACDEYDFYQSALDFSRFDLRYEMVLKRFGLFQSNAYSE